MSFGDRVRARRKALGMTAVALGEPCSTGGPRIARIELTPIQPRDGVIGRQLVDRLKILGAALQADGETRSV
jgi:hypothetical protein